MEKWDLNKHEIEAINAECIKDLLYELKTPVSKRIGFKYNSHVVTIPKIFNRYIGVESDTEEYCDKLSNLHRELSVFGKLYMKFDSGLNRDISANLQGVLGNSGQRVFKGNYMDSSELISLITEHSLINNSLNDVLIRQIKNNLKGLLDYYVKIKPSVNISELKLIVSFTLHWINLYLIELFSGFDYSEVNPKVLYYGNISNEEVFFLILLATLGCDIIYFNPENQGNFLSVDSYNVFSKEIKYAGTMSIKDFPEIKKERIKTTAYSAKEELNKTLYSESSNFYRPWQFVDYKIVAVTLKTTYEEINIWAKEKALIRDGWKIENGKVFIPNIFAKISGTHEDIEKYWKELNSLISQEHVKFYNKLPIIDVSPLEYGKFEQIYPKTSYAQFDTDKLMKSSWWKYKDLRTSLQKNIADKIKELCMNPVVFNDEPVERRDLQVDIFSVLINMKVEFLQLLQEFDYPDKVPKIIIYNNEKNGHISYEDCILLIFMNAMGVDVIIYNPSGYNDIEEHIYEDIYDTHRLEKMVFNLDYKKVIEKKGLFERFFKL